jgi:formate-nitrite transporter family protein
VRVAGRGKAASARKDAREKEFGAGFPARRKRAPAALAPKHSMVAEQQDARRQSGDDTAQPPVSGHSNPDVAEREEKQVEDRVAPPASVVYEAIRREGEEELRRPASALAWSGVAAGLSMGFSLIAEGLLRAHLPNAEWRPLIVKLGYSLGFLITVLGRQQLFTENTLTPMLPLLSGMNRTAFGRVMRLWAIVLAANLAGALAIALALGALPVFAPDIQATFREIGADAIANQGAVALLKGIFAGWLIATMVWLLPNAETARVAVIIIITYIVGLAGLTHVVAGSIEVFYMASAGAASWSDAVLGYLLPTLIGNIIGGVALVAVINHAQVVSGKGQAR